MSVKMWEFESPHKAVVKERIHKRTCNARARRCRCVPLSQTPRTMQMIRRPASLCVHYYAVLPAYSGAVFDNALLDCQVESSPYCIHLLSI